jgi:hypothetical protein
LVIEQPGLFSAWLSNVARHSYALLRNIQPRDLEIKKGHLICSRQYHKKNPSDYGVKYSSFGGAAVFLSGGYGNCGEPHNASCTLVSHQTELQYR